MPTIIPLADARRSSRREALDRFVRAAASGAGRPGAVADTRGRPLRDLRISVTDRCNFRCVYCMPKEIFGADYEFLPRAELLTFEEITRIARIFVGHGVDETPADRRRAAACAATSSAWSRCWRDSATSISR